jgi:monofunctional biosynthetic peptidoglycan transglycosylase
MYDRKSSESEVMTDLGRNEKSISKMAAAWRGIVWAFKTIWVVYQLALGFLLIVMFYLFLQIWNYFHIGDIRALRKEPPATTAFIEAERIENPDLTIRQTWIPLDSIPRVVKQLVLVAEDAKFYSHQGFDLEQIEYALVANHQAGRKMRGASTITQQTAKNLYLGGEKEMSRKVREAALALLLEQTLTKDRILEIYFNIAQFGPGVFGVREGARYHFDRDVRELTQDQMLSLICLLPSPTRWNPNRPTGAYLSHKNRVSRNYGLLRSIVPANDSLQDDAALDSLGRLLSDEDWRKLRSGPYIDRDDTGSAAGGDGAGLPAYEDQAPDAGAGEDVLPE